MKKDNIPKFLGIQDLLINLREKEKVFIDKRQEYEEFKKERLELINLKEEEIKVLEKDIKNLKDNQKEREDRIISLRDKYQDEEKKALTTKSPKEALNLEKEMESLKGQIRRLEDEILDILLELEDKNNLYSEHKKELDKFKEEFYLRNEKYEKELKELRGEIESISLEIEKNKKEIPMDEILEFENLMRQKSNRAISRVINKEVCEGCKLSLPKVVLDRLKKKEEILYCPNCGRILWIES